MWPSAFFIAVFFGSATAEHVTPIQKVIQMLEDMMAKGKAEKEDEAKRFAEYKQFCKDTSWDKVTSIKTAKADLEELAADIGKADADIMVATKEIAALNDDISSWEKSVETSTRERKEARKIFKDTHEDYVASIDAVGRALNVIKAGPDQGAAASLIETTLLQLGSGSRVSAHDRKRIMSFLQTPHRVMNALIQDAESFDQTFDQPQGTTKAYTSSSGGVIDMVEKLGEKFEQEKADLETTEATEKHAYDMMMQDLKKQIEYGSEERDSKTAFKAKTEAAKATAKEDTANTENTLAEDEKFLADLTAECEQKSVDFDQRQTTRQEELEAIAKAIEIMSSDSVSGSGAKHLPGLMQESTALAQLRSNAMSPTQRTVATFLYDRAQQTGSRILSLLAEKVAADPFKKILKMIKDMITKLTEEANEEAEHKGFCDKELGANKQTRDTKTEEAETLKADIEGLTADIAKLANDISTLGEAIVSIDAAVTKATNMRQAEHEKNTATIADAKAGKEAVAKATKVLKDFYDKAASATALIQATETFNKPYTGMGGGGVLGMLEVCESDFARLEGETTAGEDQAAKEYEQFMADSSDDKATKEKDSKHKAATKQQKESALAQAKKDLAGVQDELNSAMEYYDKLKPACIDQGESYEERVARRKEEIESLQEALKILNGESV